MAEEKKPGFFGRLFGGKAVEPPPAPPPAPVTPPPSPAIEEDVVVFAPEAAPVVLPPEPVVVVPPPPVPAPQEEAFDPDTFDDSAYFGAPRAPEPEPPKPSWLQRLKAGLSRSSGSIGQGIVSVFAKRKLDDETLEELENVLIQADLGVETALAITGRLAEGRFGRDVTDQEVKTILAEEVEKVLAPVARPLAVYPGRAPHVILVVGVNGSGKTTTIGKLAAKYRAERRSVTLAAGDTFRAAAIDQLKVWGERTGVPVVARPVGSDAAGLAFDALTEAKAEGRDVILIDTAGRLQNKTELMAELEKVVRVIRKVDPTAPHDVLLVLDATVGQNALQQVEIFGRVAGVTGLVMTKLDGTARGGILVAIARKFGLPVHFVGVGESVDDLEPFEARDFARAIAGLD